MLKAFRAKAHRHYRCKVVSSSLRNRFIYMAGSSLLFILNVDFLILHHLEQALGINCFHSAKTLQHLCFSPLGGCDEKTSCLYIFLFIILRSYHSVTPNQSHLG